MKRGKKFAKSLRYKFDWKFGLFADDINRRRTQETTETVDMSRRRALTFANRV